MKIDGSCVAQVVSWPALGAVLVPLVLMGVFRLLAEQQRRTTLVALIRQAPGGTVVLQENGPGGPPMWVWVGEGPRSPMAPMITLSISSDSAVRPPDEHRG